MLAHRDSEQLRDIKPQLHNTYHGDESQHIKSMTTIAQVTGNVDPSEFERVLAAFDEDALVAIAVTILLSRSGLPKSEPKTQKNSLVYRTCAEQGITLDVLYIHHDKTETKESKDEKITIERF